MSIDDESFLPQSDDVLVVAVDVISELAHLVRLHRILVDFDQEHHGSAGRPHHRLQQVRWAVGRRTEESSEEAARGAEGLWRDDVDGHVGGPQREMEGFDGEGQELMIGDALGDDARHFDV